MLRLWNPITAVMLVLATLVSLALLVLAMTFPVYSSESVSATVEGGQAAEVVRSSATLVSVNGFGALIPVAVPLVATLLVGLLLRAAASRAEYAVAWVLTLLYAGLCVLALLSIGILLAPVAVLLVVACATARLSWAPAPAPA